MISALILFKHAALAPLFRFSQYDQKIGEFRGVRKKRVHMGEDVFIIYSHFGFLNIEMLVFLKDKFF